MRSTRIAVIGAGRLGTYHARLVNQVEGAELVAVADPVSQSRRRLAEECGVPAVEDFRDLISRVDAAIVAAPTVCHADICSALLENDIHVLVEKPITATSVQAGRLIELAGQRERVLQVGHVERFNPALTAVDVAALAPRFIQAQRTSGYTCRSTDVGVVLDLMIHDLDIVLSMDNSEIVDVDARGGRIFGPHEDVAFATLHFASGLSAAFQASRVSQNAVRQMKIWGNEGEVEIDFNAHQATTTTRAGQLQAGELDISAWDEDQKSHLRDHLFTDYLPVDVVTVDSTNALLDEQVDFVTSIRNGSSPRVTGCQGRDALAVAERIVQGLQRNLWYAGRQREPERSQTPWRWPAEWSPAEGRRRAG